jgi:hypothetical protein
VSLIPIVSTETTSTRRALMIAHTCSRSQASMVQAAEEITAIDLTAGDLCVGEDEAADFDR